MLEIENVSKTFKDSDGFVALKDVNFTAQKGEFVCLLGPSGCGKTVLLYRKKGFKIDFDEIDFGYSIGEIELMAKNIGDINNASEKIVAFAARHGVSIEHVCGKVVEYLKRNNQAHFQALVDAGVVKP